MFTVQVVYCESDSASAFIVRGAGNCAKSSVKFTAPFPPIFNSHVVNFGADCACLFNSENRSIRGQPPHNLQDLFLVSIIESTEFTFDVFNHPLLLVICFCIELAVNSRSVTLNSFRIFEFGSILRIPCPRNLITGIRIVLVSPVVVILGRIPVLFKRISIVQSNIGCIPSAERQCLHGKAAQSKHNCTCKCDDDGKSFLFHN